MSQRGKNNKVSRSEKSSFWWSHRWRIAGIFAVLAFLLYATTLKHGFVLDDTLVIVNNAFVKKGISGLSGIFSYDTFQGYYGEDADQIKVTGGRYRPLSLAVFSVLYQIAGPAAPVFHFWNLLMYGLCCGLLYLVLRKILDPTLPANAGAALSGLITLLFVVHPIHTEVVNNIKCNDEILSLLFSLSSLFLAILYRESGKNLYAISSGAALFLGCLAKENAIVFLAIIPLTFYYRHNTFGKKKINLLPLIVSVGVAVTIYLVIRTAVIGWSLGETSLDLINNPFIKWENNQWVHISLGEKWAMIFWSLGKYIQLLFLPLTLSTDYYPRYVDVMTFSNPVALLSLLGHIALACWCVYQIVRGKRSLIVYGASCYLIALSIVSNIVFPIGTNLAERFLFAPSLGFVLVMGGLVYLLYQRISSGQNKWLLALTGVIALLCVIRIQLRNPDFTSNKTLFSADVLASPESAKVQNGLGAIIAEEALNQQNPDSVRYISQRAKTHLDKALEIHPTYLEAFYMRGNVHFMLGEYDEAVQDYRSCISLNDQYKEAYGNYALALREKARKNLASGHEINKAIEDLEESLRLFPDEKETQNLLISARQKLSSMQQ